MREQLLRALGALSVVVSAAALAVPARADDISFKVPFSFVVNGRWCFDAGVARGAGR